MPPAYEVLPPLGSAERKKMVDDLSEAFGPWKEGQSGALDPKAVYEQLSKLSYQDRITILHQVFTQQKHPDFLNKTDEPEAMVRMLLLNRLCNGADQKPRFAGVNMYLHLMSDAPKDTYYKNLLVDEIYTIQSKDFVDKDNDDVVKPLKLFKAFKVSKEPSDNNPYPLMRNIGIALDKPPLRSKDPLGEVDAPKYKTLPSADSTERNKLIDDLVKATGQPEVREKGYKGFKDPETVFKLLADYDYPSRLALYREVLKKQDKVELAEAPEEQLRMHLMRRFMHAEDGTMSYAGMDRYFRFVSDAPRDRKHTLYLRSEMEEVLMDTDYKSFVDKGDAGVKANYQRFFAIGGKHPELLYLDPYNRLELTGIRWGKPPVLPTKPAPKKGDDDGKTMGSLLDSLHWGTLGDLHPSHRLWGFPVVFDAPRVGSLPIAPKTRFAPGSVYSPLAHI